MFMFCSFNNHIKYAVIYNLEIIKEFGIFCPNVLLRLQSMLLLIIRSSLNKAFIMNSIIKILKGSRTQESQKLLDMITSTPFFKIYTGDLFNGESNLK